MSNVSSYGTEGSELISFMDTDGICTGVLQEYNFMSFQKQPRLHFTEWPDVLAPVIQNDGLWIYILSILEMYKYLIIIMINFIRLIKFLQ